MRREGQDFRDVPRSLSAGFGGSQLLHSAPDTASGHSLILLPRRPDQAVRGEELGTSHQCHLIPLRN